MKSNILKYNLLVVFLLLILLPMVNGKLGIWEFERKDENRVFKDSVNFSLDTYDQFPSECEAYVNDNFSLRSPMLDFYHYFKFRYFNVSPHPNKTIIGSDNWYFMAKKDKELFEGKHNFSTEELALFKEEWQQRSAYYDSMNIKPYWLICPIKYHIYPEKLPFNVSRQNKVKRVDQLKEYLHQDFPDLIIDPTEALVSLKDSAKLYYQLDNHWNFNAGAIASKLLIDRIKSDYPEHEVRDITHFKWKDTIMQTGIHYRVLGVDYLSEQERFPLIDNQISTEAEKYDFPPIKGFPYKWQYERRFTNKSDSSGLRVLVIRDSFGKQLMPFLKEPFAETVFIFDSWKYGRNREIIETVKPDIIIYISLESYIDHIIEE